MTKKYISILEQKPEHSLGTIDDENPSDVSLLDDISRMLLGSSIFLNFKSFWTEKSSGCDHQERMLNHKYLIQKHLKDEYHSSIDEVSNSFKTNVFDCQDGLYSLNELNKNILHFFEEEFFEKLLQTKIKKTQPVEGTGEHYLWCSFSNLDFFQGHGGDLMNTVTKEKIEVKTNCGSLGSNIKGREWDSFTSVQLAEYIKDFITPEEHSSLCSLESFCLKTAKMLSSALDKIQDDALIISILNLLSNYSSVESCILDECLALIKADHSQKSILNLVTALHLKLYAMNECFDKLILFNGGADKTITSVVIISTNKTITELTSILSTNSVVGYNWGGGKKGIRIKVE